LLHLLLNLLLHPLLHLLLHVTMYLNKPTVFLHSEQRRRPCKFTQD